MKLFLAVLAIAGFLGYSDVLLAQTSSNGNICHRMIERIESEYSIPKHLLKSIALTESGRRDPVTRQYVAWPWTVMAEGRGRYFNTKQEAIAEAKMLRARGIQNIDMGCMQVNYRYHAEHFGYSIERMFDPYQNVNYAAKFLSQLKNESGLWTKAVGHYHSKTPSRSAWYQSKVFAKWRKQRDGGSGVVLASYTPPTTLVRGNSRTASTSASMSGNMSGTRSRSDVIVYRPISAQERQQLSQNSEHMLEQRRRKQLKVIAYEN